MIVPAGLEADQVPGQQDLLASGEFEDEGDRRPLLMDLIDQAVDQLTGAG